MATCTGESAHFIEKIERENIFDVRENRTDLREDSLALCEDETELRENNPEYCEDKSKLDASSPAIPL